MKQTPADLLQVSNHLFERQYPMLSLWQTLAENFYPERADFTDVRNVGQELSDNLIDSYPILARRDMANQLSAMLRDGDWFEMTTNDEPDHESKSWMQWATRRQKHFMETRDSGFARATKEGDHDYVTFGQPVISIEPNKLRNGLLYRCWHLRDCAWFEDETGQVCGLHRKWKPTYHQMINIFKPEQLHPKIVDQARLKPFHEGEIRHIFMPAAMYGDDQITERFKYVSIYLDAEHMHLIEVTGMNHKMYTVPRFQTIAGSQYAYSPATVVALPEARLIQAMTHTLLEAGERYARPPIIAQHGVIRGDVDLTGDGITWVDKEYDEKLGAALRTLPQDRGGFPIGLDLREDVKELLNAAFYLNKLNPPDTGREMTAYEFSERMKAYRRENLPLFAPMEAEYNGQICETSFELSFSMGLLGSPQDVPPQLLEQDIAFKFRSPLTSAEEEDKRNKYNQVRDMLAAAIELDPMASHDISISNALRDAVSGIGAPNGWIVPPEAAAEGKQNAAMQAAAQQMAAMQPEGMAQ